MAHVYVLSKTLGPRGQGHSRGCSGGVDPHHQHLRTGLLPCQPLLKGLYLHYH